MQVTALLLVSEKKGKPNLFGKGKLYVQHLWPIQVNLSLCVRITHLEANEYTMITPSFCRERVIEWSKEVNCLPDSSRAFRSRPAHTRGSASQRRGSRMAGKYP